MKIKSIFGMTAAAALLTAGCANQQSNTTDDQKIVKPTCDDGENVREYMETLTWASDPVEDIPNCPAYQAKIDRAEAEAEKK